jgi:hypothetical protein
LKKLVLPLPIKGGSLLRTVDDARAYVLALPSPVQPEWELAWTLISKEADAFFGSLGLASVAAPHTA